MSMFMLLLSRCRDDHFEMEFNKLLQLLPYESGQKDVEHRVRSGYLALGFSKSRIGAKNLETLCKDNLF